MIIITINIALGDTVTMENITFAFQNGEVVLAEWRDKLYYAKILHINHVKHVCTLLFDDDSIEYCAFTKIHSGSYFQTP